MPMDSDGYPAGFFLRDGGRRALRSAQLKRCASPQARRFSSRARARLLLRLYTTPLRSALLTIACAVESP